MSREALGWAVSFRGKTVGRTICCRASLDDYVSADNPVRAVEAFIDALDMKALEFAGMTTAETGRPAYPSGRSAPTCGGCQMASFSNSSSGKPESADRSSAS